ncbi:MAG: ComEA family DNA-binding protein [Acidimicrobiia bacterium]|nr:ComEA family DNA-binding protein [Acidimicrobiia bacterium]
MVASLGGTVSEISNGAPREGDIPLRPLPPRSWRERVEQVADATGTSPLRIALGAGVALAALAGVAWLLRPTAAPPEVALPFAASTVATPLTTTTTAPVPFVVHVAGAVITPGLHELPAGARVADAITAAGGLRPDADATGINLAAPLSDGTRLYVPVVGETPPPVVLGATGPTSASGTDLPAAAVNLNTAGEEELDGLPGVGPATASAIINYRQEVGGFASVDELLDVPGIGEAKLEQLRPLVTV